MVAGILDRWQKTSYSVRVIGVDLMGRRERGARRQVEALVYHEQHQQSGRGWRGGRSLPASHNHTRELSVEKG